MDERLAAAWRCCPTIRASMCCSALGARARPRDQPAAGGAAARRPRLRWPALLVASLVQTIPSLALLALFYPLLLALSALTDAPVRLGFPALGFLPSLLALTLYSMLPILRNGVAGILGVDPAIVEAAAASA